MFVFCLAGAGRSGFLLPEAAAVGVEIAPECEDTDGHEQLAASD